MVQQAFETTAPHPSEPLASADPAFDFANPFITDDVLKDFDFDSFLHDGTGSDAGGFGFEGSFGIEDNKPSPAKAEPRIEPSTPVARTTSGRDSEIVKAHPR